MARSDIAEISAQPRASRLESLRRAAARAADTLALWQARAFERRYLLTLDDRALKDIGLSRADARREAEKPCWRE